MKQEYTYETNTPADIRDLWQTPRNIFQYWNGRYDFECDVAASDINHLCSDYFTVDDDALTIPWKDTNWCNPPYSNIAPWVKKAVYECENHDRKTVMLIPANMDTKWFMDVIHSPHACIVFLVGGRIRFVRADTQLPVGSNPRGSMFVIFDKDCDFNKFSYVDVKEFKEEKNEDL